MDIYLTQTIPEVFHPVHRQIRSGGIKEVVAKGGRGSGKSSYLSLEVVYQLLRHPDCHAVVLRKVCTVVTSRPEPVRDFIVNELHRSATMEQAQGAYTHDEKWVLTTVLTRGQAQKLRLFVHSLDEHAFITIVNSSEIVGKGFRSI